MRFIDILAKFLDMFPQYMGRVSSWAPAGNQCIRVMLNDLSSVEFAYFGDCYWKLCTAGFVSSDDGRN